MAGCRLERERMVHDEIVRAILDRDADRAEETAREHVRLALVRNMPWIEAITREMDAGQKPWMRWWTGRPINSGPDRS